MLLAVLFNSGMFECMIREIVRLSSSVAYPSSRASRPPARPPSSRAACSEEVLGDGRLPPLPEPSQVLRALEPKVLGVPEQVPLLLAHDFASTCLVLSGALVRHHTTWKQSTASGGARHDVGASPREGVVTSRVTSVTAERSPPRAQSWSQSLVGAPRPLPSVTATTCLSSRSAIIDMYL